MTSTLDQVYVMVTDLERSVRFYEETMGLFLRERGERTATFETGAVTLTLEADFDAETLADFGLEAPGENRGDGIIIVIKVDDVDEAHRRMEEDGYEAVSGPREVSWGRKMFLVRDPDGYVLEVYHPV